MELFTYVCGIKFDAKECQPRGDNTLPNTTNARCLSSETVCLINSVLPWNRQLLFQSVNGGTLGPGRDPS
jgi:hypothetical protein